jgi:hypothetical protein
MAEGNGWWDALRGLELEVDEVALERLEHAVSSEFTRVTTTVVLRGGGLEGRGEDVTYVAEEHDHLHAAPPLPITGRHTLESLSQRLDGVELFPQPPAMPAARDYRRWAFESAALDLALRQAGTSLGAALGLPYRPLRFVVSTRLDPRPWLAANPDLEFKLDAEAGWTREHMERLASTGRVRVIDLKGHYRGTPVDLLPDPVLYAAVAEIFADAIIEDPAPEPEALEALRGAEDRLSWDAPIHSVADIGALPVAPRQLNIKPSRFGRVEALLACIAHCQARGISLYGGGQFELGIGRAQIQAIASLFYADTANDTAPAVYNTSAPGPGLPPSPLPAPSPAAGIA